MLIACAVLGALLAEAPRAHAEWQSFDSGDGLPSNFVQAIRHVRSGDLWFGTASGASQFDGVSWRTVTRSQGLPSDFVQAVFEDRLGRLWMATTSGVCHLEGNTAIPLPIDNGSATHVVWSISEDDSGLWFGTDRGASHVSFDLLRSAIYSQSSTQTSTSNGLIGDDVQFVLPDRRGGYWFATTNGVSFFKD